MTGLIQLSPETRGLLSEAFPGGAERRTPRRGELSRTARAARELLWTSHREELGYCAAARAYLMEWGQKQFEGLGYTAVQHEEYLERAGTYSKGFQQQPSGWGGQALDSRGLCRIAYSLAPSGSNRLRLANSECDLELFGSLDDWRAAYSMTSDPDAHVAAAAQNLGLMLIAAGDIGGAASAYRLAWSLAGKPGDLILASLFGGQAERRCLSETDMKRAVDASVQSTVLQKSLRSVVSRLTPTVVSSVLINADAQLRGLLTVNAQKGERQ